MTNWLEDEKQGKGKSTWDASNEHKQAKRGPKPKDESLKRTGRFMVYLTDDEYERISKKAQAAGFKVSSYARTKLLEEAKD